MHLYFPFKIGDLYNSKSVWQYLFAGLPVH